jgi:imidazolonepropionase-like amidohydrolase
MTLSICARRVALLVAALALSAPARAQTGPGRIVLLNANLIDGLSQEPLKNATVVVHDGKIERVAVGVVDAPAGSTVIDLKGRWLLPGFVDAHAHLRDLKTARAVLTSGTTTVRAMGGDRLTDVGIRELNHAGLVDLPDVVAAGYQVRANMGETFFLDFPELSDLMPGVHGEEAVRRVVRALAGRGVNLIKVMATERTALARTDPLRRIFTDKELAAITDEASRLGLPVAAHAYGPDGTDAAVRAGVHSIEHGLDLTDRTLALMKERGTCYVPTMYEHVREAADGGPEGSPFVKTRTGAMVAPLRDTVVRARRAGVCRDLHRHHRPRLRRRSMDAGRSGRTGGDRDDADGSHQGGDQRCRELPDGQRTHGCGEGRARSRPDRGEWGSAAGCARPA